MTAANKHLTICFKQITSRAADLRHLCSAFDHNHTRLLQDVEQQLKRGPSDERKKEELEERRYDLMNHVALVWVRPDDVLQASHLPLPAQGDKAGDPPKIR